MKFNAESIKKLCENKRSRAVLIAVCAAGIALILFSSLAVGKTDDDKKITVDTSANTDEYVEKLEARLSKMIGEIDGAGSASVMVTLKSGTQYVYAANEKSVTEGEKERSENETETVIYDSGSADSPLVVSVMMPEIAGVLVVCDGANSAVICERVTEAVSTVLGIPASNVYITPKS